LFYILFSSSSLFFLLLFLFCCNFALLLAFISLSCFRPSYALQYFAIHISLSVSNLNTCDAYLHSHFSYIYLFFLYCRLLYKSCSPFNFQIYISFPALIFFCSSFQGVFLKEAVKYKKCSFVWLCSDPGNQASFHCRTAFRTLITKVFYAGR